MTTETVLRNARIVLEDSVLLGSIQIRDGVIADISAGASAAGEDMEGDHLIPGLVELHTDHLESHYAPRPKVRWNADASVQAHDGQVASSGITTVFDALRIGTDSDSDINFGDMNTLAESIARLNATGRLRADHLIHLRCEVSSPNCANDLARFEDLGLVRLVSLMDHAPGQRQFASLDAYSIYYQGKLKMNDEVFARFCKTRMAESEANSDTNRRMVANLCREHGIVLASHDDATLDHVREAEELGTGVAEFPTTLEAAQASHSAGMAVLMGAPNVIRGSSHSGNVSARDLAGAGCLDILSSDYIPFSLVQAAFFLQSAVEGIRLPDAVNMVARNPARAAGLDDRGLLEIGKRADVVRICAEAPVPVVRSVYRQGRRVA